MTNRMHSGRGSGHVPQTDNRTTSPRESDALTRSVASAHSDAVRNKKRYAHLMGITPRHARRAAHPVQAKGAPLYRHHEYLDRVDDAFEIVACSLAHVERRTMEHLTNADLIDLIRDLEAEDARGEGADNEAKVSRGVPAHERATLARRDATTDLKRAAAWTEADARGITESDVFGPWGSR